MIDLRPLGRYPLSFVFPAMLPELPANAVPCALNAQRQTLMRPL